CWRRSARGSGHRPPTQLNGVRSELDRPPVGAVQCPPSDQFELATGRTAAIRGSLRRPLQ
ncbi:MAG TPA: hypothetical protein VN738_03920, partial [Acidothermaceae bacterium]|nr:hypothetical protein [Acidothermaceae bacterium]